MSKLEITKYKGKPERDKIEIKRYWADWTIEGCLDDVEIHCSNDNGSNSLFLNQDELKQVIEFLQSKVK
jgi:hypothetical protein